MITGFNHSGFVVKDIEKMVAFYRDSLGLSVMREVDSVAPPEGDHTGIPGAHRTLVFVGKPEGSTRWSWCISSSRPAQEGHLHRHQLGAAHICFNVTDLAALAEKLKAEASGSSPTPSSTTRRRDVGASATSRTQRATTWSSSSRQRKRIKQ